MKKTWKTVLSLLLVIALMLPMAPLVRAEGEGDPPVSDPATDPDPTPDPTSDPDPDPDPTPDPDPAPSPAATEISLSVTEPGGTIYYRSGAATKVTVTAVITPASYDGTIEWSVTSGSDVLTSTALGSGTARSIQLTVAKAGSATVKATLPGSSSWSTSSGTCSVSVQEDSIQSVAVALSPASILVGAKSQASATATYHNGTDSSPAGVKYKSSNTKVATVNETTGQITGVAEGTANITATVGSVTSPAKTVTVKLPGTTLTGNATVGAAFSMQDFYDSILLQFSRTFSTAPSASATVSFSGLSKANGVLRTSSKAEVIANDPYIFSTLRSMYYDPTVEGSTSFVATVRDGSSVFAVDVTIQISTPTTHIRIPVSSSDNYLFSDASADSGRKTGIQLIRDAVGSFGSIKFGAVASSGSNVGTLYTSSAAGYNDRVTSGTSVEYADIGKLFFTPNRSGTYSIAYTAYSKTGGTGAVVCSGNLIIPVDGSSLDIQINLDSVDPYTFSAAPRTGAETAYSLLIDAINNAVGASAWTGIRFDGADKATATVGTLHQSSGYTRAIAAETFISKSSISGLYFTPERVGTYQITYGVYTSSADTSPLVTGTVTIVVSNIPTGSADITYATTVKGTVALRESDFIEFFQNKNGSRYYLSGVVFDDYSGTGDFYHSSTKFIPYNSTDFYCSTYSGTTPANAHYLENLSFVAPAAAGFTAVKFTCFGGTAANSTNVKTSGVLYIFYTAGDVPAITYDAYTASSVDLVASDFVNVYKTATKDSAAKPTFRIRLVNIPTGGTLYRYYSKTGRTALTSANFSGFTFAVNGAEVESVEKLTYVAGARASGTDTVAYIAYGTNGSILYSGTIQFKLSADRNVNITDDGLNFNVADFYTSTDTDPVLFVTFPAPATGRMYAYTGNRYVAATPETKFYTASAADGTYPITAALYAPRANVTGTATLNCIAHRKSGATYQEVITVNVLNKISSGSFGDVNGTTGTDWAANSVDFAYKLGLVNGTSLNPPAFSPKLTMRRCDLVLILYRMAGSPSPTGTIPYTDVETPSDSYSTEIYNSAVWAYRNGIMRNAMTGTLYNPKGALTRQDFAQILFNYTAAMGVSTANTGSITRYDDAAQVSAETLEGVTWAVANGYIISASTSAPRIEPQRTATRAEIATLLHRYFTY